MIHKINFTKMHGLGNDFIIVDKSSLPGNINLRSFVIRYSDRRLGIGCDQFIIYYQENGIIKMEIYNSDGSSAMACGNATRCLGYLLTKELENKKITIYVGGRKLNIDAAHKESVSVNMGPADFNAEWIPKRSAIAEYLAPYIGDESEFICLSVGNPHIVIFNEHLSNEDMKILGPKVEKSQIFPGGVNVNFAKLEGSHTIILKVWERGAGFTYACGSGACATFAAARKLGFVNNDVIVKFELDLLRLSMENDEIIMQGPVSLVAQGELYE